MCVCVCFIGFFLFEQYVIPLNFVLFHSCVCVCFIGFFLFEQCVIPLNFALFHSCVCVCVLLVFFCLNNMSYLLILFNFIHEQYICHICRKEMYRHAYLLHMTSPCFLLWLTKVIIELHGLLQIIFILYILYNIWLIVSLCLYHCYLFYI